MRVCGVHAGGLKPEYANKNTVNDEGSLENDEKTLESDDVAFPCGWASKKNIQGDIK